MNPLLDQFLSESREFSQGIAAKLMQLEDAPSDQGVINELFRLVHTLKGNSGLFSFPDLTRVLHAGEDLLGLVRNGQIVYSSPLADRLLEAIDLVMAMCAEIEATEQIGGSWAQEAVRMAESLRELMPAVEAEAKTPVRTAALSAPVELPPLAEIPEAARLEALRQCHDGETVHWVCYAPAPDCFFQGDDPLYSARQTPRLLWGSATSSQSLPSLAELDTYRCLLEFHLLSTASREELDEHFRYVPDQVRITQVNPLWLADPEAALMDSEAVNAVAAESAPQTGAAKSAQSVEEQVAALDAILTAQLEILRLEDHPNWFAGRLKAVATVLRNVTRAAGDRGTASELEAVLAECLATGQGSLLLLWLEASREQLIAGHAAQLAAAPGPGATPSQGTEEADATSQPGVAKPPADEGIKFGRRAEDVPGAQRSIKVDQAKIDRLMNLIGELVVSKNALPYLAQRAETQFGVRELSREIKGEYSTINRIADEMQDAIMQVRMMAVSFVFQRFPRLVRDISRKLGKEVQLVLEGEQTEADKNIIESLADPLIHIVRNSLDHGLETPEIRRARGKPETGTLTIRAAQEGDRVLIGITDDGKGIDPAIIKRKAYQKGLIDEAALERIDDREAVNLIFAAGLSTAEVVSDLSGRGVGMDVVRSAVEKLNGAVTVESRLGKGTTIRISLPLSMAVTQVMIIESDGQLFGVPMDNVVETVRVPRRSLHHIKQSMTAVLRGRTVPLKALNSLLGIPASPKLNSDDEFAVLLVQAGGEVVGLLVDGFKETAGLIQKPFGGILSGLSAFSGSALMGDGSVLMILNIREIV
jgi:two-component system chemotaxis sensor kinase CheA